MLNFSDIISKMQQVLPEDILLSDIPQYSLKEFSNLTRKILTNKEIKFIYQYALKQKRNNKIYETGVLARKNPQIQSVPMLQIEQTPETREYSEWFPERSSHFVKPGSVASMFSPAGYLTEMYAQAQRLHGKDSIYHIDKRRPDLAGLVLSQENLDTKIPVLKLANNILLENTRAYLTPDSSDDKEIYIRLAKERKTGLTPYHLEYQKVHDAIHQQDPGLTALTDSPEVIQNLDAVSLLAINSNISPELYNILIEEITAENMEDLYYKNFGSRIFAGLVDTGTLAKYYDLPLSVVEDFLGNYDINALSRASENYIDDELITFTSEGNIIRIKRYYSYRGDRVNYVDLVPGVGNGNFILKYNSNVSTKCDHFYAGMTGRKSYDLVKKENFDSLKDVEYSYDIKLDLTERKSDITIYTVKFRNATESGADYWYTDVDFSIEQFSYYAFLLKLNKVLRLHKATGLTKTEIEQVVSSDNKQEIINESVLEKLFFVKYYHEKYNISIEDALVLFNSNISQQTNVDGSASQFDRLFNKNSLSNDSFQADGSTLYLKPGVKKDDLRLAILKQAFQVNDTTLYLLAKLTNRESPDEQPLTLEYISAWYRIKILADAHAISVEELNLLLELSAYQEESFISLSGKMLVAVVQYLSRVTNWLKKERLTVYALYLMCTETYSVVADPLLENLLTTLQYSLLVKENASVDDVIVALAPLIAAGMQITDESAEYILYWIDGLTAESLLGVQEFAELVVKESHDSEETKSLVTFCQVLTQLAMIVKVLQLSPLELSVTVKSDFLFNSQRNLPEKSVDSVIGLSQFHQWVNKAGQSAGLMLNALKSGELTTELYADQLGLDMLIVKQALGHVSQEEHFNSWDTINTVQQWIHIAEVFNITPDDVDRLISLKYIIDNEHTPPDYDYWKSMANILVVGLNQSQQHQLDRALDDKLSTALCGFYIEYVSGNRLESRDDIYSYLLIDNQDSPEIVTTPLAQAISTLQHYINRVLAGLEEGVRTERLSTQYLVDWERYNKRYSTWAGVSALVYYPENYINPLQRIGQTTMMDTLLQSISQSSINEDSVSDAFMAYLTSFETIANLEVLSGYHDNKYADEGNTWFIGRNTSSPAVYYFRNVDHSKGENGKLTANAWNEWTEINSAPDVYKKMIRPVIFNNRLHIVWVELNAHNETDVSTGSVTNLAEYTLNVAYLRYDGGWSNPFRYILKSSTHTIIKDGDFYVSYVDEEDTLAVLFYNPADVSTQHAISIDKFYGFIDPALVNYSQIFEGQLNTTSVKGKVPAIIYTDLPLDTSLIVDKNQQNSANYFSIPVIKPGVSIDRTDKNNVVYNINLDVDLRCHTQTVTEFIHKLIQVTEDNVNLSDYKYKIAKFEPIATKNIKEFVDSHIYAFVYQDYPDRRVYLDSTQLDMNEILLVNDDRFTFSTPEEILKNYQSYRLSANIVQKRKINDDTERASSSTSTATKDNLYLYSNVSLHHTTHNHVFENFEVGGEYIITLYGSYDAGNGNNPIRYYFFGFKITEIETVESVTPEKLHVDIKLDNVKNVTYANIGNNTLISDTIVTDIEKMQQFIPFSISLGGEKGKVYSVYEGRVELEWDDGEYVPIIIDKAPSGVQYINQQGYRTRLNTLFAYELVKLAENGIGSILSYQAQQINEPQPGLGTYINVTIPIYNSTLHGTNNQARLWLQFSGDSDKNYIYWSGQFLSSSQGITLFFPYFGQKNKTVKILMQRQQGYRHVATVTFNDSGVGTVAKVSDWSADGDFNIVKNNKSSEFLDFEGANALYFWELFFYTVTMIVQRFIDEHNYPEASQWLKYVFNPDLSDDETGRHWNVRPLNENTSWNNDPLNSTDPDAVAQHDPMHYKVFCYLQHIEMLAQRIDDNYRELTTDGLGEAKMLAVQLSDFIGDVTTSRAQSVWHNPSLSQAADSVQQTRYEELLLALRGMAALPAERTANTLTGLFLPQLNEKLLNYRQRVDQRLYNLRHNLSIDGTPLSLPQYASAASPEALQTAAVAYSSGASALPAAYMPLRRFPLMLDNARQVVSQLIQFGSQLLAIAERQDAESAAELLQTQAQELIVTSLEIQMNTIEEVKAQRATLELSRDGTSARLTELEALITENISTGEKQAMDLSLSSSVLAASGEALHMAAAALDIVPNIYGLAVGGGRYGAVFNALAIGTSLSSNATQIASERINQSEFFRRRLEQWEMERNDTQSRLEEQISQIAALEITLHGAELQLAYLNTQQSQIQVQLEYLKRKFTGQALYSWLRGQLASVFYQFYDTTVSRCLMAQSSYRWEANDASASFIRAGAWQGAYAGLMSGEKLMLDLARMEEAYLRRDVRELEVLRTVSLSQVYSALDNGLDDFVGTLETVLNKVNTSVGDISGKVEIVSEELSFTVSLSSLDIINDYPESLGTTRRIKQISVTLPALVGPYENVQAVLSYSGSLNDFTLPRGCSAVAVSHGNSDSGLFQLDFNDGRYLPFEGIPLNNTGSLTLRFPNATGKQKRLLQTLTDVILDIRYTISD